MDTRGLIGITTRIMVLLILVQVSASCSKSYSGRKHRPAEKGTVDLRSWDFARDGPADLSGQWAFYWKQLVRDDGDANQVIPAEFIDVPGIWNGRVESGRAISGDGFATYRLRVLLPEGTGERRLALKVQDMGTAYSLFINGTAAGSGGIVAESADGSLPGYWPDVVEAETAGDRLTVTIHVSNYHHRKGGAWEPLLLGPPAMVRDIRERNCARDFFLFGSIFLMGVYHLLLFSLRKKDLPYLYFGLFCLLIAVRVPVTGEYFVIRMFPSVSWETIVAAEYLSFYAGVPVFFLFVRTLFPAEFWPKALACIVSAGILFSGAVIALPPHIYTHTMRPYQVFSAVVCLYGLAVLLRALVRKREGAVPFIAGFIVLFITVVNDFLHNNMVIQTGYLVPCGLFMFIILQAYLLSMRFSRTLAAVERLTGELELKNRRLEDMDAMKDEFLASVSHELRTPLNGIIGIAESMIEGRCGMVSLESKFNLGLINASGRRLAALVNDILDFARLKNSDIVLTPGPVDIRALVNVVLAFIRPLVGTKKLDLLNAIPAECPMVHADENRIQQVLYNLVGNAVKFTSSGSVVISSRKASREGWLEIAVTDTGCGIRNDWRGGIFSGQEGSGTTGGSGIGLSITRKLVELHGGSIRSESVPGGGSVFSFTLPLWSGAMRERKAMSALIGEDAPRDQETGAVSCETREAGASKEMARILVVDDDSVNLQVMRNHLSSQGFTVETATGGAEALDRMSRTGFDLVILDLMMPAMSGLELCGEVRKRFSLVELPIIFLTARHGVNDLVICFGSGANDYLYKPVERDELLARVRTQVELKRTVRDRDEAKYKLLQERMNPHFLFNSLNTVHALIGRDRLRADQAVIMLADNYRFLIDYSFLSLIPFDTEWRFMENYLKLEELRFEDLLSITMERHGDFSSIRIPPLTLQPLVENALKHGIRKKGGHGMIGIHAEACESLVQITVDDNGPGPSSADLFSRSLGNIRNRLYHYYRDVDLAIEKAESGGARVRLSFYRENNTLSCIRSAI